jgi:UDP-N-acetylenolpyruvoylglucosamine reductase
MRPDGIQLEKAMGELTWFRSGGKARFYFQPASETEVVRAVQWARHEKIPVHLLGMGANSLFPDEEFPGLVLHMTRFRSAGHSFQMFSPEVVETAAGVNLENLVKKLNQSGLGGFEKFVGIPGTVGGSVWGNAGAQSASLGDQVESIRLLNESGQVEWVSGDRVDWKYRSSGLGDRIILAVRFRVEPDQDPQDLEAQSTEFLKYKKRVQPYAEKSTGCIFRNPASEISAGQLIDSLNLKGIRSGGAQISTLHGNFIVNPDRKATTGDVLTLVKKVQQAVYEQRGIELEREVIVIGEDPS